MVVEAVVTAVVELWVVLVLVVVVVVVLVVVAEHEAQQYVLNGMLFIKAIVLHETPYW